MVKLILAIDVISSQTVDLIVFESGGLEKSSADLWIIQNDSPIRGLMCPGHMVCRMSFAAHCEELGSISALAAPMLGAI